MSQSFSKGLRLTSVVAILGLAAGCGATYENHGYVPQAGALAEIQSGVDTRSSVQRKIGRPGLSGVFTDQGWYYVSTTFEHYMFYEPEIVDRRIVAITFDDTNVVASVNQYGLEDGRVVDLVTRRTPTFGSELGIIQQLLSNIGVFTAEDFLGRMMASGGAGAAAYRRLPAAAPIRAKGQLKGALAGRFAGTALRVEATRVMPEKRRASCF